MVKQNLKGPEEKGSSRNTDCESAQNNAERQWFCSSFAYEAGQANTCNKRREQHILQEGFWRAKNRPNFIPTVVLPLIPVAVKLDWVLSKILSYVPQR